LSHPSDTHFDEVVNPDELGGLDAYDRPPIATHAAASGGPRGVIMLASRDYLSGVSYDGAVAMLGGDVFTGTLTRPGRDRTRNTLFGSLLLLV